MADTPDAVNVLAPATPVTDPEIKNLIYTVRGQQVMLDSDLARLYGVETGALNRAAKRNDGRFPEDFRFKIESNEIDQLRCQIGILAGQQLRNDVGRTYLPYVYTEQGVAMLSAVLRSKAAVEASVRIMRAFVEMRHFLTSNAVMLEHIRALELRQTEDHIHQLEYQKTTDERLEAITPTQRKKRNGKLV